MNRRSFIQAVPVASVTIPFLCLESVAESSETIHKPVCLESFSTAYTDSVGRCILRSGKFTKQISQLRRQLGMFGKNDVMCMQKAFSDEIERECNNGILLEVDGWVVTPAEAMLSAVIVQGVDTWK